MRATLASGRGRTLSGRSVPAVTAVAPDEEPRFWSPWRGALRPARSLYHACYTFAFRTELFERIVRVARESGGRVGPLRVSASLARRLDSEAKKETHLVRRSLRDLARAEKMGLLTASGRRLLRRMRAR